MRLGIVVAACVAFSGCALPVGDDAVLDQARFERVVVGQTSPRDIYYLYGQPHDVLIGASGSQWRYYSARGSMNPWTLVPVVGLVRNGTDFDGFVAEFTLSPQGDLVAKRQDPMAFYMSTYSAWGGAFTREAVTGAVEREMLRFELPFNADNAEAMAVFAIGVRVHEADGTANR